MPSVLLTGANSFVAAHVINALIAAGYGVTGTVRRQSAADDLFVVHPEWKGKLDIVIVGDYAKEESWDELFQKHSFDHIIHVAAPLLDDPALTDYDRDFLQPSVAGNRALLQSAHNHAPTVKSVVVTGSVNASTTGSPDELKVGPLTDKTWLPITREEARAQNNAYISYCSAKKEGELAIWDFVKSASPRYSVTVFLPALIFGPPINAVKNGVKGLNYSSNVVYGLFNGSSEEVPATTFPSYIDVRDLADAHVRALTEPKVANKRLNIGGLDMTYTDMVRALAKVPELQGRLPKESGEDKNVVKARIVADEANNALNMRYRSLEETMADTVKRILELEKTA